MSALSVILQQRALYLCTAGGERLISAALTTISSALAASLLPANERRKDALRAVSVSLARCLAPASSAYDAAQQNNDGGDNLITNGSSNSAHLENNYSPEKDLVALLSSIGYNTTDLSKAKLAIVSSEGLTRDGEVLSEPLSVLECWLKAAVMVQSNSETGSIGASSKLSEYLLPSMRHISLEELSLGEQGWEWYLTLEPQVSCESHA